MRPETVGISLFGHILFYYHFKLPCFERDVLAQLIIINFPSRKCRLDNLVRSMYIHRLAAFSKPLNCLSLYTIF